MNTEELTSKQIIRNINISILTNTELKEPYLSIYNELKGVFSDLNIYKNKECTQLTFYCKTESNLYIEYDSETKDIWLDLDNVWLKIGSKFPLSSNCIQGITTWYCNNVFGLKGITKLEYGETPNWILEKAVLIDS